MSNKGKRNRSAFYIEETELNDIKELADKLQYDQSILVATAIVEANGYFMTFICEVKEYDSTKLIAVRGRLMLKDTVNEVSLQICLPLAFPKERPILSVPISKTTLVNPAGCVNEDGYVENGYLKEWNEGCSLKELLQITIADFENEVPVFELKKFNLPRKVKDNILRVLESYPQLKVTWSKYDQSNDNQQTELMIEGLLEVEDNPAIPIRMWLNKSFPQQAPVVYVIPTENMVLKSTIELYQSGKVRNKYLKMWKYPTSNLSDLLDNLSDTYSHSYPLQMRKTDTLEGKTNNKARLILPRLKPEEPKERYISEKDMAASQKPDLSQVRDFVKSNGLSQATLDILLKNGFTDLPSIACLEENDMRSLGLSMAEFCKLRESVKKMKIKQNMSSYYNQPPTTERGREEQKECPQEDAFVRATRKLIDPLMVNNEQLTIKEEIGRGEFGIVFKGVLRTKENLPAEDVAVKTVITIPGKKGDFVQEFCEEILQLRMLNHKHIVCLKALAMIDGTPCMVLPYMANGDLRSYVSNPERILTLEDLLQMALHVSRGMKYLSDHKFVHGDLAARNCLIDSDRTVKVADFGLAKQLLRSEYMKLEADKKRPLRWMAPESIFDMIYTLKSDVWSFGILLWEMMTRGQTPYPEVRNTFLLPDMIRKGYRMECPPFVPNEIYEVMALCWIYDADKRPDFDALVSWLEDMLSADADQEAPNPSAASTGPDPGDQHESPQPSRSPVPPVPTRRSGSLRMISNQQDVPPDDEMSTLDLAQPERAEPSPLPRPRPPPPPARPISNITPPNRTAFDRRYSTP